MARCQFSLDASEGLFAVKVFASGVLSSLGHNPTIHVREFFGSIDFDVEHPEASTLGLTVESGSLESAENIPRKDRQEIEQQMRNDVLEIVRYPEITFHSETIRANPISDNLWRLDINGDLALHGVTSRHRIDAQARLRGDEIRLNGNFKLLQSTYKIKPVTALAGALKVKDELQIEFDLHGYRDS